MCMDEDIQKRNNLNMNRKIIKKQFNLLNTDNILTFRKF